MTSLTRLLSTLILLICVSGSTTAHAGSPSEKTSEQTCIPKVTYDRCLKDGVAVHEQSKKLVACDKDSAEAAAVINGLRMTGASKDKTIMDLQLRVKVLEDERDARVTITRVVLYVAAAVVVGYTAGRVHERLER